jgi:hypothetical protein
MSKLLDNKLDGFADLKDGWDGYQALAPNKPTIEQAKYIARQLIGYELQALPCDGAIQLESHTKTWDIEIYISVVEDESN